MACLDSWWGNVDTYWGNLAPADIHWGSRIGDVYWGL
ncbi:hypothetical protein EDD38_7392 [Kitasatospora cineracea]|uniref:Uncharacterized protein n=1 Tax=Kitasatospora cineracea TaxID=88074 RepID=A0A3N4RFS4_9ACTN|nr:hypothetical protein EDD38_7392 [Kitasatospora cineracea]